MIYEEMKMCKNGHHNIIYNNIKCPLCSLMKHNNEVHDFIESKGMGIVEELVEFQENNRLKNKKV